MHSCQTPSPSWGEARELGAWQDDASLLAPGNGWTAISFGHYRTISGHQTDFPIVDASIGLASRAQFGITVPYYRAHYTDGTGVHGVGDVYFNGKFSIVDPTKETHGFGLAVSPVVELLDQSPSTRGRFAWAVPVSMELRRQRYRLFGSTGYFSRGAVFASTAVEIPAKPTRLASPHGNAPPTLPYCQARWGQPVTLRRSSIG